MTQANQEIVEHSALADAIARLKERERDWPPFDHDHMLRVRTGDVRTVLAAIETLLKQQEENGWQPIETAPEWRRVLVFQREAPHTKSNRTGVFTAVLTERGWTLSGVQGRLRGEFLRPSPTYWRPLPEPPASLTKPALENK